MSGDAIPDPEPTPADGASAAPAPAVAAECRRHPGGGGGPEDPRTERAGRPTTDQARTDRPAVALCARCADYVCALCSIPIEALVYCPTCATIVRADVLRLGAYVPWEDRKRLGIARAAWRTIEGAFTRPAEMFARLPLTGGYLDPLLFAMLLRSIVVIVYGLGFAGFYLIVAAAAHDSTMLFQSLFQLLSIGFNIASATALLFMLAGLFHLFVLVFAGGGGFEATFRVVAYGRAVDLLDLIPVIGPFLRMGVQVYLYYLGLKRAHDLPPMQALFIAALPILILMLFFLLLVGMVIVVALVVAQA